MPDYLDSLALSRYRKRLLSPDLRNLVAQLDQLDSAPRSCQRCLADSSEPPATTGIERHPVPTVLHCIAGTARLDGPDGRHDLGAGDTLLIAPGAWHRHAPLRRGAMTLNVGFLGAIADVEVDSPEHGLYGQIPVQPTRLLCERALHCDDETHRRRLAGELLGQIASEEMELLDLPHPAIVRMRRALWSRLHLGLGAEELVAASGLGRSQAFALFAEVYGESPRRVLERCRLDLAEQLLRAGRSVGDCAASCGYASADSFARAWRRRHGRSPRAWLRYRGDG